MGVPAPTGLEVRERHTAVVFAGAALLDDRAVQSAQQGAPGLSFVSSLSLARHTAPSGGRACTIAVRLLNIIRTSLSPLTLATGGDSRIGRLQHLDGRAGAVVGRLQALQQVFGFPKSANEKNGLWFARQSRKKTVKKQFRLQMGRTATRSPLRMTSVTCCPTRPTMQSMTGSKIFLTSLLCDHPISMDRH